LAERQGHDQHYQNWGLVKGYGVYRFFQQYFSTNVEVRFICGRNWRKPLSQVTDKLYHLMLYQVHLIMREFKLTTLVIVESDIKHHNPNLKVNVKD
jgi:hypothetical protein